MPHYTFIKRIKYNLDIYSFNKLAAAYCVLNKFEKNILFVFISC